jgi:hypothetical protein
VISCSSIACNVLILIWSAIPEICICAQKAIPFRFVIPERPAIPTRPTAVASIMSSASVVVNKETIQLMMNQA